MKSHLLFMKDILIYCKNIIQEYFLLSMNTLSSESIVFYLKYFKYFAISLYSQHSFALHMQQTIFVVNFKIKTLC